MTDLERLRLAIADRQRVILRELVGLGDGVATQYTVQFAPVVEESERVTVADVAQTRAVDYTLDASVGLLTFTTAPAEDAYVAVSYRWSVFSDAELTALLDDGISVRAAAIEALRWLLADGERFIKYTLGQEHVDRSVVRQAILDLIAQLEQQRGYAVALIAPAGSQRAQNLEPFVGSS